jgi:hypothetical protein
MESRTPDLLHAMQALYQLSYDPNEAVKLTHLRDSSKGRVGKSLTSFSGGM